jgi:hypothetical protein
VSTEQQGMHGNGIAAQRKAVEDYLNGGKWKFMAEFTEVESGKSSDPSSPRPLLPARSVRRSWSSRAMFISSAA